MMPTGTRNYLMELLMGQVQAEQRGAEVEERTNMLPLVRYNDGTTGLGVPGAVYGPAQSAYNMLTTDRLNRALMGDDQAMQQSTRDSFDAASLAAVGGLTMSRPTNSLGMFGGRMAKTADHNALAKAEDMASRGMPREQIWDETGWFQGVDGKWRFEIDDSGARMKPYASEMSGESISLGEGLNHRDMRYAYPDFFDATDTTSPISMRYDKSPDTSGFYIDKNVQVQGPQQADMSNVRSIMLHELQHATQHREGFARGGSPSEFSAGQLRAEYNQMMNQKIQEAMDADPTAAESYRALNRYRTKMEANYGPDWGQKASEFDLDEYNRLEGALLARPIGRSLFDLDSTRQQMFSDWEHWQGAPRREYQRLAGETEARAVETRRDLTPEQRRARAPWLDYDVPESEQIVRFR